MLSEILHRIAARIIFIIGLIFMLLGIAFLFGSMNEISSAAIFLSFLVVVAGCFLAFFSIRLNKSSAYLFFASFFILTGFFLFLSALRIIPVAFSHAWPLLSVFSGLALLPAGWRRYSRFRANFVVPSIVFLFLGCGLLIFSFRMVPFSFSQFILNWWPLLFALGGILLVLLSLGTKRTTGENSPRSKGSHSGE
jgi:hypothetical protein